MKKLLFILLTLNTTAFAKLNIIVSIQPQLEFISKIAGDRVSSSLMVQAGDSPHTYEPKPSQMKNISNANLYFAIGVEFEQVWLDKFKTQNRKLIVKDITKDINKTEGQHSLDPHVWVDPINVKIMAKNICSILIEQDSKNSKYYKENLNSYLQELDKTNMEIKEILKKLPSGSTFMVFHPSWGYFAKRYNLTELAVEVDGKSPKMKALMMIIKKAKEQKVHAIFTQPEFSEKSAKIIANSLDIPIIKASPLASNWAENLKRLAKAIANEKE